MEKYANAVGPALIGKRGITGLLSDSIEAGPQNWTSGMIAAFRQRRGYDPLLWLPALTGVPIGGAEASDRFLWDWRQTIAELLADAHYGSIAAVAHRQGLTYYAEALEDHRPLLGDDLAIRARADVPMGAMWVPAGSRPTLIADLQGASSVANVYGRKFVAAEMFTAFGTPFAEGPRDLRPAADLAFALGVNRMMIQTSPHQPFVDRRPGMMLSPLLGQNFTRNETWAEMAVGWTDYLARCSWLLQQGHHAADAAVFVGEEAPLTALYGDKPFDGLPIGYSFDFVGAEGLANELSVSADGALISKGGVRYKFLLLDGSSSWMTLSTLRRLGVLVRDGATVVGTRPKGSPSLADDPTQWAALADGLWSGAQSGRGRVLPTATAAIAALGLEPDWKLSTAPARDDVAVQHRLMKDGNVWFVVNRRTIPLASEISFRSAGGAPEVWDAVTGNRFVVPFRTEGDRTVVPIALPPASSIFIVFRKTTRPIVSPKPSSPPLMIAEWNNGWTLALGGAQPIALHGLPSWTALPAPEERYFSGVGSYDRVVRILGPWLKHRDALSLDLGVVADVADVRINGRPAGIVWATGQRLRVGALLRRGDNRIEVRVANLWVNRLVGDAQPGARPHTFTSGPTYRADAQLLPSGLLSNVRLFKDTAGTPSQEGPLR